MIFVTSYLVTASVTNQFDLKRSIKGAANDVQAAINAASAACRKIQRLRRRPTARSNRRTCQTWLLSATSETLPLTTVSDAYDALSRSRSARTAGAAQLIIGGQ